MKAADYYSELMKQDFLDASGVSYTKPAIMFFLRENSFIIDTDIHELSKFIYRFYYEQPQFCLTNSNLVVKNIKKYSPADIEPHVIDNLISWMNNGNKILLFDGYGIKTNPKVILNDNDKILLEQVFQALIRQKIRKPITYKPELGEELNDALFLLEKGDYEAYLKAINKTRFRNRAFENIDYCACCDDSSKNDLVALHLNPADNLYDSKNSIVLCYEHAILYLKGYFRFQKNGKIKIIKNHSLLDSRMHLSVKYLNSISKENLVED